jgi:hypothetical protein
MALIKGVNSFADVGEFDAYFTDRLDVSAAQEADNATKAAALISATGILDELSWTGAIVDPNQPLAFPRSGSYFDPRVGGRMFLQDIPDRIVKATLELAYHLLANDGIQDSSGSVRNISVGTINLTGIQNASVIPLRVKTIIKPLRINAGANSWWRAN